MKISLLVPTRMRPQFMKELWESVKETASDYNHIEIIHHLMLLSVVDKIISVKIQILTIKFKME